MHNHVLLVSDSNAHALTLKPSCATTVSADTTNRTVCPQPTTVNGKTNDTKFFYSTGLQNQKHKNGETMLEFKYQKSNLNKVGIDLSHVREFSKKKTTSPKSQIPGMH